MEDVFKNLAMLSTGNCMISKGENVKCLENIIRSLLKDKQEQSNVRNSKGGSQEKSQHRIKEVDTSKLISQYKQLLDMCTSVKETACEIGKVSNPGEEFPICSNTSYRGNGDTMHPYSPKKSYNKLQNGIENGEDKRKDFNGMHKKSSNVLFKNSSRSLNHDARQNGNYASRKSSRQSSRDFSPGGSNQSLPRYSREGSKLSHSSHRRSSSVPQASAEERNPSQCVPLSMFCMTLVVMSIIVLATFLFSSMVIVQFGPPNTLQDNEFELDKTTEPDVNIETEGSAVGIGYKCNGKIPNSGESSNTKEHVTDKQQAAKTDYFHCKRKSGKVDEEP